MKNKLTLVSTLLVVAGILMAFSCVLPQDPPAPAYITFSKMNGENQITLAFANKLDEHGKATKDFQIGNTRTAKIYYTTDGSVPTKESAVYNFKPITITQNTIVKAFAVQEQAPHYLKPNAATEEEKKLLWTYEIVAPIEYATYTLTAPEVQFTGVSGVGIVDGVITLETADAKSEIEMSLVTPDDAAKISLFIPTAQYSTSAGKINFTVSDNNDDTVTLTITPTAKSSTTFVIKKGEPKEIMLKALTTKKHWDTSKATLLKVVVNVPLEPQTP